MGEPSALCSVSRLDRNVVHVTTQRPCHEGRVFLFNLRAVPVDRGHGDGKLL